MLLVRSIGGGARESHDSHVAARTLLLSLLSDNGSIDPEIFSANTVAGRMLQLLLANPEGRYPADIESAEDRMDVGSEDGDAPDAAEASEPGPVGSAAGPIRSEPSIRRRRRPYPARPRASRPDGGNASPSAASIGVRLRARSAIERGGDVDQVIADHDISHPDDIAELREFAAEPRSNRRRR